MMAWIRRADRGTWRSGGAVDVALRSMTTRAGGLAVISLALLLLGPPVALGASPSPITGAGGDPRSSGQGPGFVGDAGTAILGTLAIGVGAALATSVYVRVTRRRRPTDDR